MKTSYYNTDVVHILNKQNCLFFTQNMKFYSNFEQLLVPKQMQEIILCLYCTHDPSYFKCP